jgi:uncharacterized membrane protein
MSAAASPVTFDIGDLLSRAWKALMANAVVLILGMIVIVIVQFLVQFVAAIVLGRAAAMAQLVLNGPFMLGYCTVVLCAARNQPTDFGQLFSGFQRFLPAFLANLVISIFAGIGMVLCILPGLFVGIIYSLTYFVLHDRDVDFWPAMEESRKTVMASLGSWLLLFLVVIALNLAGAIPCGLGLLITGPLTAVMLAMAYDQATAHA